MSLQGRVIVITGASAGIGAATASLLASHGADLVLSSRRTAPLDELKSRILDSHPSARILTRSTDVTQQDQVNALIGGAVSEFGRVDALICCAGVMYYTLLSNALTLQWDSMVDVNCKGLLHCLAAVVPGMVSRGRGHVVAMSSDAGRKVFPGLGVYSATKFFVEATLQSLRLETKGQGLRVTSVQPGNTRTDLLNMSTDEQAVKLYGEPSGAEILDPRDVAEAVLYALCAPEHVGVNEILIQPREEPI